MIVPEPQVHDPLFKPEKLSDGVCALNRGKLRTHSSMELPSCACPRWTRGVRPPELSNCYCHPGRAGGTPKILASLTRSDSRQAAIARQAPWLAGNAAQTERLPHVHHGKSKAETDRPAANKIADHDPVCVTLVIITENERINRTDPINRERQLGRSPCRLVRPSRNS
jgi:hypothetical protein